MSDRTLGDVASFQDRYGDERTIHRTTRGLRVKRGPSTPILVLNQAISGLIGERVKRYRQERSYTLIQLAHRIGIRSGHPKERIWAIENSIRREGIRLGTLYALAIALDVQPADLLPSKKEVLALADVEEIIEPTLV